MLFLCSARSCGWCQSKGCEWNDGTDQTRGGSPTCERTGHKGDAWCIHLEDCCSMLCVWTNVLIHDSQSYICSACDLLLNRLAHLQRFVPKVSSKTDEWSSMTIWLCSQRDSLWSLCCRWTSHMERVNWLCLRYWLTEHPWQHSFSLRLVGLNINRLDPWSGF